MNILSRPRREFLNVCVFPSSYLFLSFHTADSRSVTTYVQSRVSTRMGVTSHMKHAYRTYRYHGEYLRMHLRSIVRCHSHAANQSTLFSFFFFSTSLWIIHRNSRLVQRFDRSIQRVLKDDRCYVIILSRLDSWKPSIHARHEDTQIHAHRYSAPYVWRARRRYTLGEKKVGKGKRKRRRRNDESALARSLLRVEG